jgi:hypothetical protein
MNKIELKELAIEKLNTNEIKKIKKQMCEMIIDAKQKKECMSEFDKNFIKSFIRARENKV